MAGLKKGTWEAFEPFRLRCVVTAISLECLAAAKQLHDEDNKFNKKKRNKPFSARKKLKNRWDQNISFLEKLEGDIEQEWEKKDCLPNYFNFMDLVVVEINYIHELYFGSFELDWKQIYFGSINQ